MERFPVEAGHILCFARAIGDANPAYYGAMTGTEPVPAPPTFVQASAQFEATYPIGSGIGERPFYVAEHFTFEKRLRNAAHVNADQWLLGPGR